MSSDSVHPWHIFVQRIQHSAACSTSGVSQLLQSAAERCQRPQAPFAAIASGDKKKKRRKSKTKVDAASADGAQTEPIRRKLTKEELDRKRKAWTLKKLQKKRVRINGKRINLLELAKQIVHDRKVKEVAGDEPQIRDMSHRELIDSIPGQDLRPGAFKMQLRAREEAQLPLDLLARGMTFSPRPVLGSLFGGRRDLTFGIYGRADEARKLLDEKWSGLPLEYVMDGQEFFDDVLDNAAQLELTVMAMPVRPLPLAALREGLCRRLAPRLDRSGQETSTADEAGSAEVKSNKSARSQDWKQLQSLAATFSDKSLRGSSFVDKQGNLIPDAHYIFSALPDSSLLAEVITPGNLRDRTTYKAGPWRSKKLTRAVFDMFLGPDPLDEQARLQAGQALVYLTNGFKLSPDPSNPNQVFEDDGQPMWPKPSMKKLEPSPELFSLEGKGKTSQLVNNVERRRFYFAA